jgi:hypothetical protein
MRALGWATGRLRDLHDELTWAYAATLRPVSPPPTAQTAPPAIQRPSRRVQATTPASPNPPKQARAVPTDPPEPITRTSPVSVVHWSAALRSSRSARRWSQSAWHCPPRTGRREFQGVVALTLGRSAKRAFASKVRMVRSVCTACAAMIRS